jgi:hypothetical protein
MNPITTAMYMTIWIYPLRNILAKISAPDFAVVVTGVVLAAPVLVVPGAVVGDNL